MKPAPSNMLLFLVRSAWRYAGVARPRMVLYFFLFIIANIILVCQPLVLAKIINTMQVKGADGIHDMLLWAALYAIITVCFWLFHAPARVIERRAAYHGYFNFTTALYRMVTEMPLRWHQDHHSGDTINRVNKASRALFNFMQEIFVIIQMVVRFSVSMIILGSYSLWVALVSLAVSGVIALAIRRFDKSLVPMVATRNEYEHRLNATLFDYISNIVTVLTLRLQDNTKQEVGHRIAVMKPSFWKEVKINELKWCAVSMLLISTQAGILGAYLALNVRPGEMLAIGSAVAIFQYLLIINQVFYDAANIYERLMYRHADLRSVDGLLSDHAQLPQIPAADSLRRWKQLHLQELSFTHHEGEDVLHHLRDVDLKIAPGQKIALVGTSGAGKTTLLTLLRGMYEAQKVKVKIDQTEFESLLPLSGFTTLVPQDSEIFENTILYNLTLDTEVEDEVVQQALKVTTFDDVADKLPKKLLTDIREKGVNLSGGQKQRLALARGLIAARDSSLLLLDEPTSSVDLPTESVIFDRLLEAFKDKAIVASIHRLHLLPRFDYICLMRDGTIIEQGNFADLLEAKGEFYNLWQHHLAQAASGEIESMAS